ncbi:MAG: hypothetical protein EZS28_033905, partial [Streblomastix strix]
MSVTELNSEINAIWSNAQANDGFFNELRDAEQKVQQLHRHRGRKKSSYKNVDKFAQTEDRTEPEIDSKTKRARRQAGKVLSQLIGYFNRDVKRNRELASFTSAREYTSRYPKFGYRVEAIDLDKDKDTPDNTVVYRKNGNIYAVVGFFTVPGFGGKNKQTGKRILKSIDTLQGYFGTVDY